MKNYTKEKKIIIFPHFSSFAFLVPLFNFFACEIKYQEEKFETPRRRV